MRDSHDLRAPGAAPESAAPEGSAPHPLTQADIAWLARIFAGRSPAEIAQMKAILDAFTAAAPPPAMPERDQLALLDVTDDLGQLRALFIALDMALADIQDRDARSALRTLSDTILTHLRPLRDKIDHIRNRARGNTDDEEPNRRE